MTGSPSIDESMTNGSQSQLDARILTTKVFSAKSVTKIASWNVRTLYQTGKLAQVLKEVKEYNLDVLGVCEMRWIGQGKTIKDGITILHSGHSVDHARGVGIFLKGEAAKALISWEPVSDRIITARLHCRHVKVSIIQAYAPTTVTDDQEKDAFYDRLLDTVNELPSHDLKILMGDFNAQINNDRQNFESIIGPHGIAKETNDNGERFKLFCSHTGFSIANTFFKHKLIHKYTWVSPDSKTKNEIDYVCINDRWRSAITDVRSYRGADCGSDHQLLITRLRLRFKRLPKKQIPKAFDVGKLKENTVLEQYQQTLSAKFESIVMHNQIDERWQQFKDIVTDVAEETIGRRRGSRKEAWISVETWRLIDERKKAKLNREQAKSFNDISYYNRLYNELNKSVKKSCKRDKRTWIEAKCQQAEHSASMNDSRTLYKIVRDLTGKSVNTDVPVKDTNGKLLNTEEMQNKRWVEHFKSVLNQPIPSELFDLQEEVDNARDNPNISLEEITEDEIVFALKQMKTNKASGLDFIPSELLKLGGHSIIKELTEIANIIWSNESTPTDWNNGVITRLPKKGDLSNCDNWRGITLLATTRKVISRVLLKRIQDHTDELLREEQAGFRKGRSVNEQVFTLRTIIEQCLEFNVPLVVNYVDFKKAFDSIYRPSLWQILRIYGIPEKYTNIFKSLYEDTQCCIKVNSGFTEFFKIETGVQQGDLPSPFFFLLVIDFVLKKTTEGTDHGIDWKEALKLTDLDFADDLALLDHLCYSMQGLTDKLKESAGRVGLRISDTKTKIQKFLNLPDDSDIVLNNTPLEDVDSFQYLGSTVSRSGDIDREITSRIGKGSAVFRSMQRVWSSKSFSRKIKLRLYNSIVLKTVLHACETWKSTKKIQCQLDVFHMRCLRRILNISLRDRITNETILRMANSRRLSETIADSRIQFTGHLLRLPQSRYARTAVDWIPANGKRSRGRPKATWRSTVKNDLRARGTNWFQAPRLAQDRKKWRKVVARCPTRVGGTR